MFERYLLPGFAIFLCLVCILIGLGHNSLPAEPVRNEFKPERYSYLVYGHSLNGTIAYGTAFKLKYKNKTFLISAEHVCVSLMPPKKVVPLISTEYGMVATRVVATTTTDDLCIMELPKIMNRDDKEALSLSNKAPFLNEYLSTVGFPGGNFKIITGGNFIGAKLLNTNARFPEYGFNQRYISLFNYICIPGQSGSPVMNSSGQVVGVVVIQWDEWSAFVPLENLREFLDLNYK